MVVSFHDPALSASRTIQRCLGVLVNGRVVQSQCAELGVGRVQQIRERHGISRRKKPDVEGGVHAFILSCTSLSVTAGGPSDPPVTAIVERPTLRIVVNQYALLMTDLDVLFISGDIGGNVPPTLGIAAELGRRGHRVTVAGIRERPGGGWPDGIAEVPLPALADMDVSHNPGRLGHLPTLGRMAMGAAVTRNVRALLARQRADVVVVDGVMLTSIREALRSGIPAAVLFHSLGQFWSDGMGSAPLNALLRPFGLAPSAMWDRVDAVLLPTDRDLDPAGTGSSRFAFEWLGTTERGLPPEPRAAGEPRLVLVSLSTAGRRSRAMSTDESSRRWGSSLEASHRCARS